MTNDAASAPSRLRRRCASVWLFVWLIGAAIVAGSSACRDYQHTNPFDLLTPDSELKVLGPDTLFTIGEVAKFSSAAALGPFTDPTSIWTSSIFDDFNGDYAGTFVLYRAPLYPLTETTTVTDSIGHYDTAAGRSAWTRAFSKNVVLTQRLVHIQVRCPDTHMCDTLNTGGAWSVWVDGMDAGGTQIVGLELPGTNPAKGTPIAVFASRDTTVAAVAPVGVRAANVTALKSGTTWIVATRIAKPDTLRDSLQVVVR